MKYIFRTFFAFVLLLAVIAPTASASTIRPSGFGITNAEFVEAYNARLSGLDAISMADGYDVDKSKDLFALPAAPEEGVSIVTQGGSKEVKTIQVVLLGETANIETMLAVFDRVVRITATDVSATDRHAAIADLLIQSITNANYKPYKQSIIYFGNDNEYIINYSYSDDKKTFLFVKGTLE